MFADDTNLFFSESSYEKVLQVTNEKLKSIDNWFTANVGEDLTAGDKDLLIR